MHYEEQTVSLRTLIQWGLEEDTERRIAALPPMNRKAIKSCKMQKNSAP